MQLSWSSAMATGIRQIDLQHQELIELINALDRACGAGDAQAALSEALPRLAAYVLFHFGTEEELMRASGIASDHFALHKSQHQDFAERIRAQGADSDAAARLPEFVEFLKAWLVEHIMGTDRKLVAVLRAHPPIGVAVEPIAQ